MKSITSAITLGLLLLCCLRTWANVNEASCPPPLTLCAESNSYQSLSNCQCDSDCKEDEKCCVVDCHKECINVTPVEKEGQCPVDVDFPTCKTMDPNNIENECATDRNCTGNKKCCYSGCRYRCLLPLEDKPGSCPYYDASDCIFKKPPPNPCHDDKQCPGSDRCCCSNCGYQCTPTVRVKRGHCPVNPKECPIEDAEASSSKQNPVPDKCCDNDGDCSDDLKCCDSCGKKCVKPIKEHPGFCPVNNERISCITTLGKALCDNDEDCEESEKCCLSGDHMECVPAMEEKEGCCPRTLAKCLTPLPKPMCQNDSCCEGIQKCCTPYCETKCTDPIIVKRGHCPEVKTTGNCEDSSPFDECSTDCDCLETQTCCNDGCMFRCADTKG